MARQARVVVAGHPHHVTQRGNRRQTVFFCDEDYALYIELLAEHAAKAGVEIWAYCLMPNHVHLILVPRDSDGLRRALGEAHRRYAAHVNAREDWRGHLWQERFHSCALDGDHLAAAARYVENNPVRAGLVRRAEKWRWSSAAAHLAGRDDGLVRTAPLLKMIGDWRRFLAGDEAEETLDALRHHGRTGRPLGDERFLARAERILDRPLRPGRPGRPRKSPPPGGKDEGRGKK
jgi:putative transposase